MPVHRTICRPTLNGRWGAHGLAYGRLPAPWRLINAEPISIICCGAIFWGVAGFGQSVAGLLLGFCVFLPMYIFGVVGAGDVKLMAAVGAFMGPPETATAILFTLIAGGALGMITLIDKDGFRQTLGRYAFGLKYLIKSGFWLGGRHASNPAAPRLRFPYALAISIGTVSALLAPPFFKWNTT